MDFASSEGLPPSIHTAGIYGHGVGVRGIAAGSAGAATFAWGTANLALYVPIFLPFRYPVRNLFVYNFATVNGNVDVAIHSDGDNPVKIVSSGAVAQAGASALQFFNVDTILDPGMYYLSMSSSSTTATFAGIGSPSATRMRYMGILQQATAHPLPASATPAAVATLAKVPIIGMTYLSGTPVF